MMRVLFPVLAFSVFLVVVSCREEIELSHRLKVNVNGAGSVKIEPQLDAYKTGAEVTLTAIATQGYELNSWGGDLSGADVKVTLVMDSDKTVNADFTRSSFPEYGYSIDPTNPLILKTFSSEGDVLFYGTKHEDGTVASVDFVSVKTVEYDEPVFIELADDGRPLRIFGPLGDALEFDWTSESQVTVRAQAPNGVTVALPLEMSLGGDGGGRIRRQSLTPSEKNGIEPKASQGRRETEVADNGRLKTWSNLTVKLTQCGMPFDDATVVVLAKGVDVGGYQPQYKARSNGDGTYSFKIDYPEPIDVDADKICSSVTSALSKLCTYVEPLTTYVVLQDPLCASIAFIFNAAALPVYGTCEVLLKSLTLYCKTLGYSGDVPCVGDPCPPSIGESLCPLLKDNAVPTQFTFVPAVYIDGGKYFVGQETEAYPTGGPFPDITVSLPNKFASSESPLDILRAHSWRTFDILYDGISGKGSGGSNCDYDDILIFNENYTVGWNAGAIQCKGDTEIESTYNYSMSDCFQTLKISYSENNEIEYTINSIEFDLLIISERTSLESWMTRTVIFKPE